MGKHPEIKEQLACINYMADRLTSTEKKDLRATGKEVPPTPKPPTDSDEDEDDQEESQATQGEDSKGKGKEVVEVIEAAELSNKGKEVTNLAGDGHVEVTSSEIFVGYESLGKIYSLDHSCNRIG